MSARISVFLCGTPRVTDADVVMDSEVGMELVFTRVAAIDVHKRQVTVAVRTPAADGGRVLAATQADDGARGGVIGGADAGARAGSGLTVAVGAATVTIFGSG